MREADRLNQFIRLTKAFAPVTLCDWLKDNGFFTAPASCKYHGNYEGGLYDHSTMVADSLIWLTDSLKLSWERPESPAIVGWFHDLCKIDEYQKVMDNEGVMLFGKDEPAGQECHFEHADPILKGHGGKSILLLSQFMTLTPEEMHCIRFHMGAYEKDDWSAYGRAIERFPNVLYAHTADMIAAKVKGV